MSSLHQGGESSPFTDIGSHGAGFPYVAEIKHRGAAISKLHDLGMTKVDDNVRVAASIPGRLRPA
jgi:hypothetical protein